MKKLIVGRINSANIIGYWNTGDIYTPDVEVGDYAIVENKTDYDLIKIIGILETEEKYEKMLVNNGVSKKVVKYLARNQVRED